MLLLLQPNCRNIGTWLLLRFEQQRPKLLPALDSWEKQYGDKFEQGGSVPYFTTDLGNNSKSVEA